MFKVSSGLLAVPLTVSCEPTGTATGVGADFDGRRIPLHVVGILADQRKLQRRIGNDLDRVVPHSGVAADDVEMDRGKQSGELVAVFLQHRSLGGGEARRGADGLHRLAIRAAGFVAVADLDPVGQHGISVSPRKARTRRSKFAPAATLAAPSLKPTTSRRILRGQSLSASSRFRCVHKLKHVRAQPGEQADRGRQSQGDDQLPHPRHGVEDFGHARGGHLVLRRGGRCWPASTD